VVLPECRRALQAIATQLDLVAILSGRPAEEAHRMVGLDGLVYVGNHGLDRWDRQLGYRSQAASYERETRELLTALESDLHHIPGARIEDKSVSLSLHYRAAADPDAARGEVLRLLERLLPPGRFAVREGKMVVEVRPPLGLDKGTVVETLAREYGLEAAVFLGDDLTDIDAMKAIRRLREAGRLAGLTIGVGSDEMPDGLAEQSDFVLPDPPTVSLFLGRLARALPNPSA